MPILYFTLVVFLLVVSLQGLECLMVYLIQATKALILPFTVLQVVARVIIIWVLQVTVVFQQEFVILEPLAAFLARLEFEVFDIVVQ